MLSVNMHLTVRRPSPTTISFTVSNATRRSSLGAKMVFYLAVALRIITCSSVLLALGAKAYSNYLYPPSSWLVSSVPAGLLVIASRAQWELLLPTTVILLFFSLRRFHTGTS
jgi:phosphatidylinositol glycan class H protein